MMNVASWPKSVMRRIGPPLVGYAQMSVIGPSVSSTASHLSSGESTGCISSQLDKRDPEIRTSFGAALFSGVATIISISDKPFSAGKLVHEEESSSRCNRRLLSFLAHQVVGTTRRRGFLYAKSILARGRELDPLAVGRPTSPTAAVRYFCERHFHRDSSATDRRSTH